MWILGLKKGLNREFTALPNFLLVLKVLLIFHFSDFNPSKRICGTPFSIELSLANSESLCDGRCYYISSETLEEIF